MRKTIYLEDGSRYIADTETDATLYGAPRNPPNTGSRYTRGVDLVVHKTKLHGNQFYLLHWTMWQGEEANIVPVSFEEANKFLQEHIGDYWNFPSEEERKVLEEYGFKVLVEDA